MQSLLLLMNSAAARVPLFVPAAAFSAGILLSFAAAVPFTIGMALGFFLLLLLGMLRKKAGFILCLAAYFILLGNFYYSKSLLRPADAVENFEALEPLNIEGVVASFPEIKKSGKRIRCAFTLETEKIIRAENGRFRTFEVSGKTQAYSYQPGYFPKLGDRVLVHGKLSRTIPALEPYVFNLHGYLASKNIYSTIKAYGHGALRPAGETRLSLWGRIIYSMRRGIGERIDYLWEDPYSSYFRAFILGVRPELEQSAFDAFAATGTAHLLSISGLHLALTTGSLFFLLLLAGWPRKEAAAAGIIASFLFAFIGGAGIPLIRSALMASAAFTAILIDRPVRSLNIFCFVYLLFLIIEPKMIRSISFQLSFLSIFMLIVFPYRQGRTGRTLIIQSWAAFLGTFPIVIYYFNIFPVLSVPANLIAVPLFHFGLLSGFLAIIFGNLPAAGPLFASLAEVLMEGCIRSVEFLAAIPFSHFSVPRPELFAVAGYYAVLAGCLTWAKLTKTSMGFRKHLLLSAAALFLFIQTPRHEFFLHVFGTEKSLLVHAYFQKDHHWLIYTGKGTRSFSEMRPKINSYMKRYGISRLEGIWTLHMSHSLAKNLSRGMPPRYVFYIHKGDFIPREDFVSRHGFKEALADNWILFGKDRYLRGFNSFDGGGIIQAVSKKKSFVIVSEFSPQSLKVMQTRLEDLRNSAYLVLPPLMSEGEKATALKLIESAAPDKVVLYNAPGDIKTRLTERKVPFQVVQESGWLRIS